MILCAELGGRSEAKFVGEGLVYPELRNALPVAPSIVLLEGIPRWVHRLILAANFCVIL